VLLQRLRDRGEFGTSSPEFLARTLDYVRYFRDPARNTLSDVIDNTHLSPVTAEAVGQWIRAKVDMQH
jgi:hypothetical protein